jgi:hypothetical protein
MESSRCGRVCYGVPSWLWACLFLCEFSSCWERRKLCIHYTQHGIRLQKCQPSLLYACLWTLMGSIFSPRWTCFDTYFFFLSTLLDARRSFISSFFSNVTKDLGDCCCPRTLSTAQTREHSCDKVTPGGEPPEFTTFPCLFSAGMRV